MVLRFQFFSVTSAILYSGFSFVSFCYMRNIITCRPLANYLLLIIFLSKIAKILYIFALCLVILKANVRLRLDVVPKCRSAVAELALRFD